MKYVYLVLIGLLFVSQGFADDIKDLVVAIDKKYEFTDSKEALKTIIIEFLKGEFIATKSEPENRAKALQIVAEFPFKDIEFEVLENLARNEFSSAELNKLLAIGDSDKLKKIWAKVNETETPDFDSKLQTFKPVNTDNKKRKQVEIFARYDFNRTKVHTEEFINIFETLLQFVLVKDEWAIIDNFKSAVSEGTSSDYSDFYYHELAKCIYIFDNLDLEYVTHINKLREDQNYFRFTSLTDRALAETFKRLVEAVIAD